MRHARWAAILLLLSFATACQAKQLAVIVDRGNPADQISLEELVKIFKCTKHSWPDGQPIKIVISEADAVEMQIIADRLYRSTPDDVKVLLAAHKDSVVLVRSGEDVLRIVGTVRGAIGLVDVYAITSNIKVLKIDDKLPLQADYPLRGH